MAFEFIKKFGEALIPIRKMDAQRMFKGVKNPVKTFRGFRIKKSDYSSWKMGK